MTRSNIHTTKETYHDVALTLFCGGTDEATRQRLHVHDKRKSSFSRKALDINSIRLVI